MKRLALLLFLLPVIATAQRMEIAGITRGMTYRELWKTLSDSSAWKPPYEPYDIKDDYFVYPSDSSVLGQLGVSFVLIYVRKGKVEKISVQTNYKGRVGVDSLRSQISPVWKQALRWSHGAIGTKNMPPIPAVDDIYSWQDKQTLNLGVWTQGSDQIKVEASAGDTGDYYLCIDLWQKGR